MTTTDSIHGPCEGYADVIDRESYRDVHQRAMQAKGERVLEMTASRAAYVNWGRWVVDCECNGSGLSDRTIKQARCFDCGRVYNVTFPKRAAQIEKVLLERPDPSTRNWAGETVQALLDENVMHLDDVT